MSIKSFLLLLFVGMLVTVTSAQPVVKNQYEWQQQGYYILNPAFAHGQTELVFVRQASGRDSTLPASGFTAGALKNYLPQDSIRLYDPVVTLLNTKTKRFSLLDYGWAPAFSADDDRIVYSYQFQPLKKGDRLYAAALEGNYLKLFNRRAGKAKAITTSKRFYQTDPVFADSSTVIYKIGQPVNGPYGGGIAFNQLNLKTGKISILQQAAIKHRLYALMGDAYRVDDRMAYTVYMPADTGSGMAARYTHLLLSGKDTLQDFGTRAYTDLNYKFAYTKRGELLYLQDNSFTANDTSFLITYKDRERLSKKPLLFKFTKCYLSPDGSYLLYITPKQEAMLMSLNNWKTVRLPLPQRAFHAIRWNPSGRQLALVQDHPTLSGTDKLYVFSIQPR